MGAAHSNMTGLTMDLSQQGAFGTYASSVLFRKQGGQRHGGERPAHRGAYVVSLAQEAKESSLVIPSVAEDAAPAAVGAGQETEAPAAQAQTTNFASAVLSKETDFLELPQPVRYEELQKECLMSLRPETFEGMRFDFTKPLNQR